MKARRRGFTIVELMIVIVIIGILIAIIVPTVTSAIDSANKASDQSDMKNMNTQLQLYKIMEDVSSVDYHAAYCGSRQTDTVCSPRRRISHSGSIQGPRR